MSPRWEHHDRTHLQLELDYPAGPHAYCWEAYFFIPQSFRIGPSSYGAQRVYADFVSYVRLPARERSLAEVYEVSIPRLEQVLAGDDVEAKGREARRLACAVRASVRASLRALEEAPEVDEAAVSNALALAAALVPRARRAFAAPLEGPEPMATTAAWVVEDLSLMIEQYLGRMALALDGRSAEALADEARRHAIGEVERRAHWSRFPRTSSGRPSRRAIERIEFMRHTLKRFTSSVLWLDFEIFDPSRWAKQVLFAFAASCAMAFAVTAALWNGDPLGSQKMGLWLIVAILAYAVKDRIKAWLQSMFARLLRRYFPDRRWYVRHPDGKRPSTIVDETTRFRGFDELPIDVLATRRMTRRHPLEEIARPENVLWHRKVVRLGAGADETGLTEVFRLDLARWLANTDDPKTSLVLADPERGELREVTAPRVYNIGIVHRTWRRDAEQPPPPWKRERVVVSRKGIRRVESIC